MQWAIVIAAFLASAIEFVEAFTLVLVARITTNWRSAIVGALAAVATLAVIVGTLGVALVTLIPLDVLRFVIGFLLLLFGLKWLKNAIQRFGGLKLLHDEEAIYQARVAEAHARGESVKSGLAPFGVLLSYKGEQYPERSEAALDGFPSCVCLGHSGLVNGLFVVQELEPAEALNGIFEPFEAKQ